MIIISSPRDRNCIGFTVVLVLSLGSMQYKTYSTRLSQLERVQKRIADRKMKLQVSDAAIKLLGSLGYDPSYGARPVKRVIQQNVENELAKGILRGQFKDEDTVLIDTEVTAFSNGQLPQQKLVFKRLDSDSDTTAEKAETFSKTV